MNDLVKDHAVAFPFLGGAEDATAQRGPVEWPPCGVVLAYGVIGWEEEIGRAGPEVVDDCLVAGGAGFDDFAGEEVGVDDGEGVRGG